MATLYEDGDRIALSRLDVQLLIWLLKGKTNAYIIAKQWQEDYSTSHAPSISTIQHSLKSMELIDIVKKTEGTPTGQRRQSVYSITNLGRALLDAELQSLERLVQLARKRSN